MKTIKIDEKLHKQLLLIKSVFGYKTLNETIDMCLGEFVEQNCFSDVREAIYDIIKK